MIKKLFFSTILTVWSTLSASAVTGLQPFEPTTVVTMSDGWGDVSYYYYAGLRAPFAYSIAYPQYVKAYRLISVINEARDEGVKTGVWVAYGADEVIPANTPVILRSDYNGLHEVNTLIAHEGVASQAYDGSLYTDYTDGDTYSSATMPTLYRLPLADGEDVDGHKVVGPHFFVPVQDGERLSDEMVYFANDMIGNKFVWNLSLYETINTVPYHIRGSMVYITDDDLTVVHEDIDRGVLYCKGSTPVEEQQTIVAGQMDYISYSGLMTRDYDQSYWISLYCPDIEGKTSEAGKWVGRKLRNVLGSFTSSIFPGMYTELIAPPGYSYNIRCMTLLQKPTAGEVDSDYSVGQVLDTGDGLNTYVPANFIGTQTGSDGKEYFFVKPQLMEVCDVTWAVWSSTTVMPNESGEPLEGMTGAFVHPASGQTTADGAPVNSFGVKGGVAANFALNAAPYSGQAVLASQGGPLQDNQAYKFRALVLTITKASTLPSTGGSGELPSPRRANSVEGDDSEVSSSYVLLPLDLINDRIVTEVTDTKAARVPVGVTYHNLAGMTANRPWSGVNIVVTEYNDGSRQSVTRVLR